MMVAKTIDVQTSQAGLKDLMQWVKEGTEITLTDGDTVVARIIPVEATYSEFVSQYLGER